MYCDPQLCALSGSCGEGETRAAASPLWQEAERRGEAHVSQEQLSNIMGSLRSAEVDPQM